MIQYSEDICYNLKLYYNRLKKLSAIKCISKISGEESNKIISGHKGMNAWQETEYLLVPHHKWSVNDSCSFCMGIRAHL